MNIAPAGPAPLANLVQQYWDSRQALLQAIPNPETRDLVKALIDGRVIERVNDDVPAPLRQGMLLSFSTLQETQAVFTLMDAFSSQWIRRFLREAVPYVAVVQYRYMKAPEIRALIEAWDARDNVMFGVLLAAGPWLALQGLAVVGFTANGIAAGSLAALWQSSIGNVVAGSLFSSLQSFGALGTLGGPWGFVAGAAAVGAYEVYKRVTMPPAEERFRAMLRTLLQNTAERAKFWASINV